MLSIVRRGVPYRLIKGLIMGMEHFRKTKNKITRAYAQSGQYHTIVESRDS